MYSILLLMSILSVYFWVIMYEKLKAGERVRIAHAAGYLVSTLCMSYSHYFGLYFTALQCCGAMLFFPKTRRSLCHVVIIYLAFVILYLPCVPILFHQFRNNLGLISGRIETPNQKVFFKYLKYIFKTNPTSLGIYLIYVLYGFLLGRTLYERIKKRQKGKSRFFSLNSGLLLTLWLIVPFVGIYIKSLMSFPLIHNRYLIISIPAAYLLVARSIMRLPLHRMG